MKKFILAALLLASPVQAATFTITVDAQQAKGIVFMTKKENDAHKDDPAYVPLTEQQWLQSILQSLFNNFAQQLKESRNIDALQLQQKYDNATPQVQQQVNSLLGQ